MGKNASSTPAPLKDRIKGSRTNKSGSAASKKSAQGIKLNASIIAGLTKKAKEYNEKHPKNKVSVTTLKAVMRRGMGAYSKSHRPTITGGAPNTRQAWAYARVNAFLRKKGGQGAKPTYVQDNDLLAHGGQLGKEITCVNCGWHWNTNDSDPSDKYVCHKCGYDNRTYYDKDPIGEFNKAQIYKSIKPLRQANETIDKIKSMERQNKMANGGEIDYTKDALEFFKKELGIKSDIVLVQSKSGFDPMSMSQLMGSVTSKKDNKFYVAVNFNETKNRFIRVLAHELVHVKQMEDGRLRFEGDKIIFDDEKMTYDEYQKRYYSDDIPKFEDEAFTQERVLQNKYAEKENSFAHGGLTKSLSVVDVHKKYPELPKSFINAQLYLGMKSEMEHTKNPDVAKKIALDHLSESPFYYEYLTKMEKELVGLDVKEHYEEQKNYAKGGEINPDNKGVKDYFAHGSGNVGGVLVGKRHSEGGIKAVNKSTNQPLEMEGGEVVITRNAVSDNEKREFEGEMLTNREILSRINESGGGVSFADGGDIPESINTSGKEYKYGGKMVKDHDIVSSCGCKHTMAEGGKLNTEIFNEMYGHKFKSGGQIYAQGGVVRIINKEIPTYLAYQDLFKNLNTKDLKNNYKQFLKENYKINLMQLPQNIRTGLLIGSQKLIDNYINA